MSSPAPKGMPQVAREFGLSRKALNNNKALTPDGDPELSTFSPCSRRWA
jgi:DNA-binding phage protein